MMLEYFKKIIQITSPKSLLPVVMDYVFIEKLITGINGEKLMLELVK